MMNMENHSARFLGTMVLLFTTSAAITAAWCRAMPAMGGFPMPGGWTLPTSWMRMPGQTWAGNALSFTAMWTTMMLAMMLPSIAPGLSRFRRVALQSGKGRANAATAALITGYYGVWAALGAIVYACGAAAAAAAMAWPACARAVPAAAAVAVLAAGAWQLTTSKSRLLACCRRMLCDPAMRTDLRTSVRTGARMGLHCCRSCAGPMAVLLAVGVMDLRAMTAVTFAISAERLAPDGPRAARIGGLAAIALGLYLLAFPPAGGCA